MTDTTVSVNSLLAPGEVLLECGWAYGLPGSRDSGAGAWLFAASCDDPAAALTAARDEWVASLAAQAAAGAEFDFGRYPNWGDFVIGVDDDLLARHGLRRLVHSPAVHVSVNHDDAVFLDT